MRPLPVRVIETRVRPGAMLLRACAAFGLALRRVPAPDLCARHDLDRCAAWLDRSLKPGQIALVAGSSGSGKSTVLHLLRARVERGGGRVGAIDPARKQVRRARRAQRSILSVLHGPLALRLGALASAGLGEAVLLARTPSELSEGQFFRLLLARAMQRFSSAGATLLCDEFASTLDRRTARTLAAALRRWASGRAVRVVVATAHDDLLDSLDPDLLVSLDLEGPVRTAARQRAPRPPPGETHDHTGATAGVPRARRAG